MATLGTIITIAAVAIIILAILGAIFAKSTTPEPEADTVIAKYTQNGWRGHSKNF